MDRVDAEAGSSSIVPGIGTEATTNEQGHDPIPEVEWGSVRPLFRELYIDERKSLRECMQLLQSNYGFPRGPYRATERMFKTRISRWGFDVKKIRHQVWESMYAKYQERRHTENKDTWFEAMVSGVPKVITFADIKKQFRRKDPKKPSTMDHAKVLELLRRADLRFFTPPGSPQLRPQRHDGPLLVDVGASFVGESPPRNQMDVPSSISPFIAASTKPWTASVYPVTADNDGQKHRLLPILSSGGIRQAPQNTRRVRTNDTPPSSDSDEETTIDFSQRFSRAMTFDPTSSPAVRQRFSLYTGVGAATREPSPDDSYDRDDLLVGQWGYHHMLACIYCESEALSARHREEATTIFETILRRAHKFILPGLNWMTSNLLTISRAKYKSFLDQSIEVIDRLQGDNLMYGHLYKYARAVLDEDESEIDRLGAMFGQTRAQFQLIFGPGESLNMLVLDYYYLWHLLTKGQHQAAFPRLHTLLVTSERLAGPLDLLTINCLTMISRAHIDINEPGEALRYLIDACHRSKVGHGHQNPFRLRLIHRLALLHQTLGNFAEAERCLREVLVSRTEVLGISNNYTWGSVLALREFLISQNRAQEAENVRTEMEYKLMLYQKEQMALNPGIAESDAMVTTQNLHIHLTYHDQDEAAACIDA